MFFRFFSSKEQLFNNLQFHALIHPEAEKNVVLIFLVIIVMREMQMVGNLQLPHGD